MNILDFSMRIGLAVALGFLIGTERELTGHRVGIRTNVLVCMGACMFTLFSQLVGAADLTRIAAQVVTGIGFLCSGIILKEGLSVRGLNTAATIWCTAAVGVITASGHALFAVIAVAFLIFSNIFFRFVAGKIQPMVSVSEDSVYLVSVSCREEDEFSIRSAIIKNLKTSKVLLTNLESADVIGNKVEIEATIHVKGRRQDEYIERLTAKIALAKGVNKVGWEIL